MAETPEPQTAADSAPAPKVFISHAGEDRERFAKPFAKRLREKGVDAWASFWEINPGDSLVHKIFDEGLKNCETILIVLSDNSINKPWVREELNAGMVRKIEDGRKLIPIRLDKCEVPECLKHTCWLDIQELQSYDNEFQRILNVIFGQNDKPPLGEPPAYIQKKSAEYEGLSKNDAVIFTAACIHATKTASRHIEKEWLEPEMTGLGFTPEQVMESLDVMENRDYIKLYRVMGPPHIYDMRISESGFNQYARTQPEYRKAMESVALMIVRDGLDGSHRMTEHSDLPQRFIEHALFVLEHHGFLRTTEMMDGDIAVEWWSPELRREVESTS